MYSFFNNKNFYIAIPVAFFVTLAGLLGYLYHRYQTISSKTPITTASSHPLYIDHAKYSKIRKRLSIGFITYHEYLLLLRRSPHGKLLIWIGYEGNTYSDQAALKNRLSVAILESGPNTIHIVPAMAGGIGEIGDVLLSLREQHPETTRGVLVLAIANTNAVTSESRINWSKADYALLFKTHSIHKSSIMPVDYTGYFKPKFHSWVITMMIAAVNSPQITSATLFVLEGNEIVYHTIQDFLKRRREMKDLKKVCIRLECGWKTHSSIISSSSDDPNKNNNNNHGDNNVDNHNKDKNNDDNDNNIHNVNNNNNNSPTLPDSQHDFKLASESTSYPLPFKSKSESELHSTHSAKKSLYPKWTPLFRFKPQISKEKLKLKGNMKIPDSAKDLNQSIPLQPISSPSSSSSPSTSTTTLPQSSSSTQHTSIPILSSVHSTSSPNSSSSSTALTPTSKLQSLSNPMTAAPSSPFSSSYTLHGSTSLSPNSININPISSDISPVRKSTEKDLEKGIVTSSNRTLISSPSSSSFSPTSSPSGILWSGQAATESFIQFGSEFTKLMHEEGLKCRITVVHSERRFGYDIPILTNLQAYQILEKIGKCPPLPSPPLSLPSPNPSHSTSPFSSLSPPPNSTSSSLTNLPNTTTISSNLNPVHSSHHFHPNNPFSSSSSSTFSPPSSQSLPTFSSHIASTSQHAELSTLSIHNNTKNDNNNNKNNNNDNKDEDKNTMTIEVDNKSKDITTMEWNKSLESSKIFKKSWITNLFSNQFLSKTSSSSSTFLSPTHPSLLSSPIPNSTSSTSSSSKNHQRLPHQHYKGHRFHDHLLGVSNKNIKENQIYLRTLLDVMRKADQTSPVWVAIDDVV